MSPTSWSIQDWLIILGFFVSGVGLILTTQHRIISNLLKERWDGHERRLSALEVGQDEVRDEITDVRIDITALQTACNIRHNRGEI